MKIVVDAMGGDFAPENIVAGAVEFVQENKDVFITLIGIQDEVNRELAKHTYPKELINVVHAPEVVGMDEPAITSIRAKRNSSITLGIKLIKEKHCDAFISAGNTGAVVAAATLGLGMLQGVERPAIGLVIPNLEGFSFLIDVGANAGAKPIHLLQSAQMAQVYSKDILGVASPKVGLLNIGEEAGKGNVFAKEAYKLMEEDVKGFVGNVEPNEIFKGRADCIVCDGFVGNVVIKVSEGLMESAGKLIKREVKRNFLAIIGAFLMKKTLKNIKKHADYSEYGGAPLLGVDGNVVICHGRSSPKAIKNAILKTTQQVKDDILTTLSQKIQGETNV